MTTETTGTGKNLPTHELYLVRQPKKEGGKAFWKKIGAAWPHKDRKGLGVLFDGDLVLRERKEKEAPASKEPLEAL